MAAVGQRTSDRGIGTVPLEIEYQAPPDVRDVLASLGRTEDVRFAPSGRRLAILCFARGELAIADIEIAGSEPRPEIAVTGVTRFASAALRDPHGVDFVDDETLVVASREAGVAVFRLPSPMPSGDVARIDPLGPVVGRASDSPGSVAVHVRRPGETVVLVCNNAANTVTRHRLDGGGTIGAGEVVARRWLDLPDGLAISQDGRWLAVSNHDSATVFVYEYASLGEDAEPIGILRGAHYPHGLRFGAGGHRLFVADAGTPCVHVFAAPGGDWRRAAYPTVTFRVMDDETFARGRHNPKEGGPKGIDLDLRTNVLAVTAEMRPLAFFDVSAPHDADDGAHGLVRYELQALARSEQLKAAACEAQFHLAELRETKAWRLTAPLRRANAALARIKHRG